MAMVYHGALCSYEFMVALVLSTTYKHGSYFENSFSFQDEILLLIYC